MVKKEAIFGIEINLDSKSELLHKIENDIKQKKQSVVISMNPEKIIFSKKDQEVYQILNLATYTIVDGIGIKIASKINGGNVKTRVTGIDLFEALVELASITEKRVGFYGAKAGIANLAAERLSEMYPNLNVGFIKDGFSSCDDEVIQEINEAKIDILFVGLGSPKQEKWIYKNKDKLNVPILQGVGGAFDIFSGQVKRAPKIFRVVGLEWLYRLMKEPNRIKRQLKLFTFLFEVIKRRFSTKKGIQQVFTYENPPKNDKN